MGLFVNQNDQRSELQERIAAELREKAKASGLQEKASLDGVEDVKKYLEDTKQTTTLAPAWILIIIMAAVVVGMFLMQGR